MSVSPQIVESVLVDLHTSGLTSSAIIGEVTRFRRNTFDLKTRNQLTAKVAKILS